MQYVVTGYAYKDYLSNKELAAGGIFSEGASLDKAMAGEWVWVAE